LSILEQGLLLPPDLQTQEGNSASDIETMGEENAMASTATLKAAKKELRSLMKKKLSVISNSAVSSQSKVH
jgi:hypothetical protein